MGCCPGRWVMAGAVKFRQTGEPNEVTADAVVVITQTSNSDGAL